ncbi:MAG: hypothetical protein QQW96_00325 [Tychonema bourrellyi B0820]|uniref:hypothetical protein n=1 Tax=Tychonema bourrellyi TaxID=54313 RepID=UPI00117F231D|nr:hypothetical protein [Tychonema bourrellyi]MDQ2096085.1 hypothetical protein [Tychonema bourrellyi B0820]
MTNPIKYVYKSQECFKLAISRSPLNQTIADRPRPGKPRSPWLLIAAIAQNPPISYQNPQSPQISPGINSSIQNPKSQIQNRLTAAPICGYALKLEVACL